MIVKINMDAAMGKMEELCAALLEQPAFAELRLMIDQFVANEAAVQQYNRFVDRYHEMQNKEAEGTEVSDEEIRAYEDEEKALYANELTRKFIYAQNEFEKVQNTLHLYLHKTIELNRLPRADELKHNSSCGCGGACGSGH